MTDHSNNRSGAGENPDLLEKLLVSEHSAGFESLLANIAHAFNNLLITIQGSNDLAFGLADPSSPIRRELSQIHDAVENAKELVNQLIVFSSGKTHTAGPVDPERFVAALTRVLRVIVPERIRLSSHIDSGLPPVVIDELAVRRTITNLVMNAVEAIPGDGSIRIRAYRRMLDAEEAARNGKGTPGEHVCIAVEDDGTGIDPADIARIFDPFFSRKRGGLGLGLPIAFVTMHRHDGFVEVASVPGKGSAFTIWIPVRSAMAASVPSASGASDLEHRKGASERLLIVEDEDEVLKFVTRALQRYGYQVTAARSAAECEAVFERENGKFHLLFSDMALPDGNGFDIARRLSEKSPGLSVVLTSGYVVQRSVIDEFTALGFQFLKKPYRVSDMLAAIRERLDRPGL